MSLQLLGQVKSWLASFEWAVYDHPSLPLVAAVVPPLQVPELVV